jgi:hypothetical protein
MKYECFIKPGFRCAEIDAASAEEAVDFFVSAIIDNLGPEHVVVNNLDTEDGEDPAGYTVGGAAPGTLGAMVGPFDHEMCLHCMTINDDMDAICLKRGRRRCQQLPCPDFKHCEDGSNARLDRQEEAQP